MFPPLSSAADNVSRAGNVLLSFNNKPATDAIPLFAPVLSPLAQGLNPLLSQWSQSPLRGGVELVQRQIRRAPRRAASTPSLPSPAMLAAARHGTCAPCSASRGVWEGGSGEAVCARAAGRGAAASRRHHHYLPPTPTAF